MLQSSLEHARRRAAPVLPARSGGRSGHLSKSATQSLHSLTNVATAVRKKTVGDWRTQLSPLIVTLYPVASTLSMYGAPLALLVLVLAVAPPSGNAAVHW